MQVTPTLHCGSFFAPNLNSHSDENQIFIIYLFDGLVVIGANQRDY
jgi:hypothetical protein